MKDLFRYVLMGSGDMCVVEVFGLLYGLLLIQKLSVTNWDTPQHVS